MVHSIVSTLHSSRLEPDLTFSYNLKEMVKGNNSIWLLLSIVCVHKIYLLTYVNLSKFNHEQTAVVQYLYCKFLMQHLQKSSRKYVRIKRRTKTIIHW